MIDRVARRGTEAATLAGIDHQVIEAARTRTPKHLTIWLLRLVVRLEQLAFEKRHRRALAECRVTVAQGADGLGYVTGEASATDAAAIDGMLAAAARTSVPTIHAPTTTPVRPREELMASPLIETSSSSQRDGAILYHVETGRAPEPGPSRS